MTDVELEILPGSVSDTEQEEIRRNLTLLYSTRAGELALDRDFGIDVEMIGKPTEVALVDYTAEIVAKTAIYEPRAVVSDVKWSDSNVLEGNLKPKVVIELV